MKKNILLIMTDQHRWDYTGYSGQGKIQTPNIDKIAAGASFSCCQTSNPICQPARTALLTGRYSHQIGTLSMSGDLNRQIPTFLHALQKNGYFTAASGKLHYLQYTWGGTAGLVKLDLTAIKDEIKKYGFDELWEAAGKQLLNHSYCDYRAYLEKKGLYNLYLDSVIAAGGNGATPDFPEDKGLPCVLPENDYIDIVTTDMMLSQLDNRPEDKPFFAFCSLSSPHKPFDPPKRYLDMIPYEEIDDFIPGERALTDAEKKRLYVKRRAYKAMILLIDRQVGRLIDYLDEKNLLDDTVIIFTADHGEMMGDHFRIQKMLPWKASSTIPLAIRHPDYITGRACSSAVELTDVTATILDIAGLDPQRALAKDWPAFNAQIPAKSLMPMIKGEAVSVRAFSFTEFDGDWQMLQTDRFKYIKYLKTESPDVRNEALYDLVNDPDETNNLAASKNHFNLMEWFRRRREYLLDTTQPAQTSWADYA